MRSGETVPPSPELVDVDCWRLADGLVFSVLSSLVLWSVLLSTLYRVLA